MVTNRKLKKLCTSWGDGFALLESADPGNIAPGDDYLVILEPLAITYDDIDRLYKSHVESHADMTSPVVTCPEKKLIYYGSAVVRKEITWFDEKIITYQDSQSDSIFNYVKPTMVFYPGCFIARGHVLLARCPDTCQDATNLLAMPEYPTWDVRVSPFATVQRLSKDTKDTKGTKGTKDTQMPACVPECAISDFDFEIECMGEHFSQMFEHGRASFKLQPHKYIEGGPKKHILIVETELLTPDKDCGSAYMLTVIRILRRKFEVHFFPMNGGFTRQYARILQYMGVFVHAGERQLDTYLRNNFNVYDYIFVSRLNEMHQTYETVRKTCPRARIVFITHDLHSLRIKREKALGEHAPSDMFARCASSVENIASLEQYYIQQCDASVVVSLFEKEYLDALGIPCTFIPVCYEADSINRYPIGMTRDMYFIGSRHTPNVDAVNFFLRHVFPHVVKKLPNVKLYIIGECCTKIERELVDVMRKNVVLVPHMPEADLKRFFSHVRLNIVPLRYGAGIKGKILQAAKYHIPTVTSSIGVEGTVFTREDVLQINSQIGIVPMDSKATRRAARGYADKLVEYYGNTELLEKCAQGAYVKFMENYSEVACERYISEMFRDLDNRPRHVVPKYHMAVLFNSYNKPHVANHVAEYLHRMFANISFDMFIINNGPNSGESVGAHVHTRAEIIEGDNTVNEFTGFQKCINFLVETNRIHLYHSVLITNDSVATSYPLRFANRPREHILATCILETVCGMRDRHGSTVSLDNFSYISWYRACFVFINTSVLKRLGYKILYYRPEDLFDDSGMLKISIDKRLYKTLTQWLAQPRYIKQDKCKKMACIANEARLSVELDRHDQHKWEKIILSDAYA